MSGDGWVALHADVEVRPDGTLAGSEGASRTFKAHEDGLRSGYVYRIRSCEPKDAAVGGLERVLYVGMASGGARAVNRRVLGLWSGGHSACRALYWMAIARSRTRERLVVTVEVQPTAEPELIEVVELHRFALAHGHLPVLNTRWEGYLAGRALALLVERAGHRSFPAYDLPRGDAPRVATICNAGEPWHGALVWIWPDRWTGKPRGEGAGDLLWLARGGDGRLPGEVLPTIEWLAEARVRHRWPADVLAADGEEAALQDGLKRLFNEVPPAIRREG